MVSDSFSIGIGKDAEIFIKTFVNEVIQKLKKPRIAELLIAFELRNICEHLNIYDTIRSEMLGGLVYGSEPW